MPQLPAISPGSGTPRFAHDGSCWQITKYYLPKSLYRQAFAVSDHARGSYQQVSWIFSSLILRGERQFAIDNRYAFPSLPPFHQV